ncbi:MAG: hypothetical protein V3U93_05030 [Alphaproteobacteria bacterium]
MSGVRTDPKFQAKRTHARPTGPGELARAREMRKRGLHLRLIEAWRPLPTYPKTKWNRTMTEQELKSLRTVIRYLWRDEQRNFEECELNDGGPPDDHVFPHLETLDHYLNREPTDDVPSEQTSDASPFI